MKYLHIILAIALAFGCFFGFRETIGQKYRESETFELNPINYIFVKSDLEDFSAQELLLQCSFAEEKKQKLQSRLDWQKQIAEQWLALEDSLKKSPEKREIVYVQRIAASHIMMAPAYYKKNYAGNIISEEGKGAEKEKFCVIYLSDGKIIKASTKSNTAFMGIQIGEKVLKTTRKKLRTGKTGDIFWFDCRAKLNISKVEYSYIGDKYHVQYPQKYGVHVPLFLKLETETTYEPLF